MRRALALFAALAALGAGALVAPTGCAGAAMTHACFSNVECPAGAQCVLGECTSSPRTFPVDLDVQPLPASGYLPQPLTGVPPQATGEVDVVVPQPVTVHVRASAPVRVTFNAEGDLRHPLSYSAEVTQAQPGVTASGVVDLVSGILDGKTGQLEPLTWDAVVVPTVTGCCDGSGSCTAPVVVRHLRLDADTNWVPPLPTSVVRITGKVVVSQASWTPIENLQVQAFDSTTGIFTLPAKTDATGAFCLAVAPPPPGQSWHLTLRLGPSDTRPTVDVPGITVTADAPDVALGAVAIGDHGAPLPPLRGRLLGPDGAPIQAARVTFDGQVDPKGTFTASATTEIDGTFSVTLLRGTYDVRAEPPAQSPDGPATLAGFDPTTLAVGDTLKLEASARPVVSGTVLGPTSGSTATPLAGVQVVADPDPSAPGTPAPQSFTAVTDASGAYRLAVDPGAYQVRFVPPPDTGLPWAVGRALSVTGDRQVETVTLEQPAILPGKVLGRTGGGSTVPLGGSKVEVYGHAPSGRAVLLWRGRAGDGGLFDVRLPQSLAGRLTGG